MMQKGGYISHNGIAFLHQGEPIIVPKKKGIQIEISVKISNSLTKEQLERLNKDLRAAIRRTCDDLLHIAKDTIVENKEKVIFT